MTIIAAIVAILLPPLGVFLVRGLGRDFLISLVLTLIFFLPGLIFSWFVIFGGSTERLAAMFSRSRSTPARG